MKTCLTLAAAALLSLGVHTDLRANHIDFISDGAFILTTDHLAGPASSVQTGDPGNIIGAEREVHLAFASGTGVLSSAALTVPVGPGPVGPSPDDVLLFDNSVGSLGTLTLTYDGVGSAGLGGLDFAASWDSLVVAVSSIQGAGDLSVAVADTSANSGTLTTSVAAAGDYAFLFGDAAYAGVDFSAVDSVVMTFTATTAATDVAFSQITRELSIPEPSTLLLGGLCLVGLGLGRRR